MRSDSFQAVLFGLQHEGEFFPATHQGLELRHFQSRRLPCCRQMSTNKIGNNSGIQQMGFVPIAGVASILFDSSRIKQADAMALAMEPQRKGMTVGSGGFQARPNFWRTLLFEHAGQLSKALRAILKAKAYPLAICSQLGLHAFLGHVEAEHGQRGSELISG